MPMGFDFLRRKSGVYVSMIRIQQRFQAPFFLIHDEPPYGKPTALPLSG